MFLLHYQWSVTLSGVFITSTGNYYIIRRSLHYRSVQAYAYINSPRNEYLRWNKPRCLLERRQLRVTHPRHIGWQSPCGKWHHCSAPRTGSTATNRPSRSEWLQPHLTRFNKIAIPGTPQMAADKEAISLSRVYPYSTMLSVTCP